jgi:hypothetical protein
VWLWILWNYYDVDGLQDTTWTLDAGAFLNTYYRRPRGVAVSEGTLMQQAGDDYLDLTSHLDISIPSSPMNARRDGIRHRRPPREHLALIGNILSSSTIDAPYLKPRCSPGALKRPLRAPAQSTADRSNDRLVAGCPPGISIDMSVKRLKLASPGMFVTNSRGFHHKTLTTPLDLLHQVALLTSPTTS